MYQDRQTQLIAVFLLVRCVSFGILQFALQRMRNEKMDFNQASYPKYNTTISLVNMWPYTGKYATVACRNERGATERKIDVS